MKRRSLLSITIFLLVSFFMFAKGSNEIPNNNDFRVVSLAPNVTEIVCALGSYENLCGRTDYCDYPETVKSISSIGNIDKPNIELIVSLAPDVAIASSIANTDIFEKLNKSGIKTYRFFEEYNGLEGTFRLIENVGNVIGKGKEAEQLIKEKKQLIENVSNTVSAVKNKKNCVLLVSWGEYGDFAATGDSFINDIIEYAGGINIAKNLKSWSISKEFLLNEDPEAIIISPIIGKTESETVQLFKTTEPYNKLHGEVLVINEDEVQRQGVRTADAIADIARMLYPQLFEK